jgi:hypothetical protein
LGLADLALFHRTEEGKEFIHLDVFGVDVAQVIARKSGWTCDVLPVCGVGTVTITLLRSKVLGRSGRRVGRKVHFEGASGGVDER